MDKKKVTILFGSPHLSYSPTVIGLYDLLSPHFDVTIVAKSPKFFDNKPLPNRRVVYMEELTGKPEKLANQMLYFLTSFFNKDIALLKKNFHHSYFYEYKFIKHYLKKENPDFIIAVDFKSLWYTQSLNKKAEFLSLEIVPNDTFYENCNFQNINSVIIQTEERYEHLFKGKEFKTFYIQNAPIYIPSQSNLNREGLVYCGTAWDAFGFYHYLNFLKEFPDYTLTVKGAILNDDKTRVEKEYNDLISGERLIIDDDYLDDTEVVDYLRKFRVGFCFYNFEIDWVNTFNYFSAPSGKLFKYFAAGVPVIGVDISGLSSVREFDCGILIKDLSPKSIKSAIDKIESNFEYYSQNCLKAASHYSFDKAAKPFIDYLVNQSACK